MSLPLPPRPSGRRDRQASIEDLLGCRRFRLGPRTAMVQASLVSLGGVVSLDVDGAPIVEVGEDPGALEAWVGDDLPPHRLQPLSGRRFPSVSLGTAQGTLGPRSFGFLDNLHGVAPLAARLERRPRVGGIAIVCGRRDELPIVDDLGRLDLGLSWLISVGDGDPGPALAFLARDEATRLVLFAPGEGARPELCRSLVEGGTLPKAMALLGGDPVMRAAFRRAGAVAMGRLRDWLAWAEIVEAEAEHARRPVAVVVEGRARLVEQAATRAGLKLPCIELGDDELEEADAVVTQRAPEADLLLLGGVPRLAGRRCLALDSLQPERTEALLSALAARLAPVLAPIPRVRAERAKAEDIVAQHGPELDDHQAKCALKAYSATVSRQAPANSPTAALRVAAQLGFPVDVVVPPGALRPTRGKPRGPPDQRARHAAELKHLVAVTLRQAEFVTIRQSFPPEGRVEMTVRLHQGVGRLAAIGDTTVLLPLDRPDAIALSRAAIGETSRALVDLLARVTAAAEELGLDLDLVLHCDDEPTVIAAAARVTRPTTP